MKLNRRMLSMPSVGKPNFVIPTVTIKAPLKKDVIKGEIATQSENNNYENEQQMAQVPGVPIVNAQDIFVNGMNQQSYQAHQPLNNFQN